MTTAAFHTWRQALSLRFAPTPSKIGERRAVVSVHAWPWMTVGRSGMDTWWAEGETVGWLPRVKMDSRTEARVRRSRCPRH